MKGQTQLKLINYDRANGYLMGEIEKELGVKRFAEFKNCLKGQ